MLTRLLALILFLTAAAVARAQDEIARHDFLVDSDPGIHLFVREVVQDHKDDRRKPILLLHGARAPGIASFDLPVAGGSFAADLARLGFDVYVVDIIGYGRSTRPKEMEEPPDSHPALVRSNEAVRDVDAVINSILRRCKISRVALFGWATGGQWASYYTSLYPDKISALIVLNSLYRGNSPHALLGHGTDVEDAAHPNQFNHASCGAYRLNDAKSVLRPWDRNIPEQDKSAWRDPAVAKAYIDAALASDPKSNSQTPPSFRSPCGALEDSFYLAIGRQLWDDSLITAPVLVLASEHDFWSRLEDRENQRADLVHSAKVRVVVIPGATHFVHLDRPERGRRILMNEIVRFLSE